MIKKIIGLVLTILLVVFLGHAGIVLFQASQHPQESKSILSKNFLLAHIYKERVQAKSKALAITLNHYMPAFEHLVDYSTGKSKEALSNYLFYYEKIIEFIPHRSEGYEMLGFCYYYGGSSEDAISAYQKAIGLNPNFFWSLYNLGVIYFKQNDYGHAEMLFKKALNTNPQATIQAIMSSKIYMDIIKSAQSHGKEVKMDLKNGYRNAYALLILSQYYRKNYSAMMNSVSEAIKTGGEGDGAFYYYASLAAYELKQYAQAISFLRECLKRSPHSYEAFHYLGLSLKALGKNDEAQKALEQSVLLKKSQDPIVFTQNDVTVQLF